VIVLVVVLVVGVAVGLITAAVLLRWPQVDPASPSVAAHAATEVIEEHPVARSFVQRRLDPATTTGLVLTVLLGVAVAGVVAAGLLLVMIKTNSGFARWDEAAGEWGADHATDTSARILRDISLLGGTSITVLAGVTVAVVQTLRTHRREIVAFLVTVFVGVTVLVNVTKWIVDRDRPDIRLAGLRRPPPALRRSGGRGRTGGGRGRTLGSDAPLARTDFGAHRAVPVPPPAPVPRPRTATAARGPGPTVPRSGPRSRSPRA